MGKKGKHCRPSTEHVPCMMCVTKRYSPYITIILMVNESRIPYDGDDCTCDLCDLLWRLPGQLFFNECILCSEYILAVSITTSFSNTSMHQISWHMLILQKRQTCRSGYLLRDVHSNYITPFFALLCLIISWSNILHQHLIKEAIQSKDFMNW